MALDAEALSVALGVETPLVEAAMEPQLAPDALAENLGVNAAAQSNRGGTLISVDQAVNTLLAVQTMNWNEIDPDERVQAAVFFIGVLGDLGINLFQTGEQRG